MGDELIRNQRKHLLSIIPVYLKFARFLSRNNLRKMLTICNRSRVPWAAAHYGIVAKVNRFSESTRENDHNFPKHMGYRTKQYRLCNISPNKPDANFTDVCLIVMSKVCKRVRL